MLRSKSVEQILEVLTRFRIRYNNGEPIIRAYQGAVDDVRRKYNLKYQTIGDLCRRRLSLKSINDFYNLLEKWVSGDPNPLMNVIIHHSEYHDHQIIKDFFLKQGNHESGTPMREILESITLHINQDAVKKLKIISITNNDSSYEWLDIEVSKIIEQKYKEWLSNQQV